MIKQFFEILQSKKYEQAQTLIEAIEGKNDAWISQDLTKGKNNDTSVSQILKIVHHFDASLQSILDATLILHKK
jgi:hypothetical protein